MNSLAWPTTFANFVIYIIYNLYNKLVKLCIILENKLQVGFD